MENKHKQTTANDEVAKIQSGYWLTQISLKKNSFTWILLLISILLGVYSYNSIVKEWVPDVKIPVLIVSASYRGVSPIDAESLLTRPLERKLLGIKGLDELKSVSTDGVSVITLEFTLDTDLQDAKNQVRDAINQAKIDLPSDADEPLIREINLSESPFYVLNLASAMPANELRAIADDIKEDIESIPGILTVNRIGGVEKEMQVFLDPQKMSYYNVSFNQVMQAISTENLNVPSGKIDLGSLSIPVRVPGEIANAQELEAMIISSPGGKPILLGDLTSKVTFGNKDIQTISRLQGKDSISLSISKRAGENLQFITAEIEKVQAQWAEKLGDSVVFTVTENQNLLVEKSLSDLVNSLILGFLLVVGVLLIVMGTTNAILVAAAIPLSMMMAIVILNFIGVTLNLVVLFALIMSLGLVVDDAIVVVENVYRHMQMGRSIKDSLKIGVGEIASPVIASTLTTMAAFFPLLFIPGIIGDFMKYFPITLISTLTCSLLVAVVFNPLLCSKLMRRPKKDQQPIDDEKNSVLESKFLQKYAQVIDWCLDRSWLTISSAFVLFFLVSYVYFGVLQLGVEFFPKDEPSNANLQINAPYGSNIEESKRIVSQVEALVEPYEQYTKSMLTNIGISRSSTSGNTPYYNYLSMQFPSWENREKQPSSVVKEIQEIVSKPENQVPGAQVYINVTTSGPPAAKPVNLDIAGPDLQVLKQLSNEIQTKIKDLPGLINLDDNLILNVNNIIIEPKRDAMARLNVRLNEITLAVRTAVSGSIPSNYNLEKEQYDIVLRYPTLIRSSIDDLRKIPIILSNGNSVLLEDLANIRLGVSAGSIRHIQRERTVTVSADALGVTGANLLTDVKKAIADIEVPAGYSISYTGENKQQSEVQSYMPVAFFMALFLIYMVMVWEFNTISTPFIVLTTVFLSIIGVIFGLTVHYKPFSIVMGGIAVVTLAGVVVKNGIVLLDYIKYKRAQGMELRQAIILSSMLRVRPIFLTAITAILALIPTLIGMDVNFFRWPNVVSFASDGGAIWQPLANAIIYGLSISTALTLIFVPCVYYKIEGYKERRAAKKQARANL